jgi:hypothetical protein
MSNPGDGTDEHESGGSGDGSDEDGGGDGIDWLSGIDWSEEPTGGSGAESSGSDSSESIDRIETGTADRDDPGDDTGSSRGDTETGGSRDEDDIGSDNTLRSESDRDDPAAGIADEREPDTDPSEPTDQIRAALSEVRREVRKAAVIHAAVEGALVAVVAGLLLSVATPAPLSGAVGLPGVVFEGLRSLPVVGTVAPRTIAVGWVVAVGLGVVAFAAACGLRLRRPLIEQFEAANPPVREALRTARDAVEGGRDTEMARRLYADVITTLRETSSLELVEGRRLLVTVLLVAVVAIAGVQVAVVNPDLGGILAGDDPGSGVQQPDDDEELQDGEEILGDAEDVEAGDEVENITVPGTGEGGDDGPTAPGVGTGGGGGSGEFDSQQAGFAGNDRIEDAELVREYNLRIREFDDEDATNDETA